MRPARVRAGVSDGPPTINSGDSNMDVQQLVSGFGPIAFGTVVLIVLWRVIVKPELDSRRIETKAFQTTMDAATDNIVALNQQVGANIEAMATLVESQRALVADLRELAASLRAG